MGMNPDTNQFEELTKAADMLELHQGLLKKQSEDTLNKLPPHQLVRPDGTPVPEHWSVFKVGEEIAIKTYVFKVAYIGETSILFEPVRPATLDERLPPESEG